MMDIPENKRKMTFTVNTVGTSSFLKVSDIGKGISGEDLKNIFLYDFTTEGTCRRFGMKTCSNYMKEMGGEIKAESEGEDKGATFILKIPVSA